MEDNLRGTNKMLTNLWSHYLDETSLFGQLTSLAVHQERRLVFCQHALETCKSLKQAFIKIQRPPTMFQRMYDFIIQHLFTTNTNHTDHFKTISQGGTMETLGTTIYGSSFSFICIISLLLLITLIGVIIITRPLISINESIAAIKNFIKKFK